METRHLEIYVALVDEGSFSKAAQKFYISQPALSQQINRLEKELGAKLIDRSARQLTQTAVGKRFYIECKKLLACALDIEQLFSDGQHGRIGRVRLGLTPSLRYGRMPSVIKKYADAHPNVEADLFFETTSQLVEMLECGQVDVAIMLTEPELEGLTSKPLFADPYVVVVPDDHPLATEEKVSFRQLKGELLISIPRINAPENHDALIAGCLQAGFSPRGPVVSGSYIDHVSLTSAGKGLSFIPSSMAKLNMENIIYKELVEPVVFANVTICWYPERTDFVLEAFLEHCFTEFNVRGKQEVGHQASLM